MKKLLTLSFVSAAVLLAALSFAQDRVYHQGDAIQTESKLPTVACYPPINLHDSKTCTNKEVTDAARQAMHDVFVHTGFEWLNDDQVAAAAYNYGATNSVDLPTPKEMLDFGKRIELLLGHPVDYVVSYRCKWHVKTINVNLIMTKTKSTCETAVIVIDMRKKIVAYCPDPVTEDSERKYSGGETAAGILLTPLVTIASGGPETPHMKRAGQISILEAMDGWVKERHPAIVVKKVAQGDRIN